MELTRDERAALAEEYIIMTLDKYKADFVKRYNRSQEPDRLLKMEREKLYHIVFTKDGGPLTVVWHLTRAGGSRSPALGAKYGNINRYGWPNDIAGLIHQYIVRAGDITEAVTFTEIVPGETRFTEGDAVALYRYFKWLEAGKIGPEITTKPDPKEQILKMFLVRRDGSGGVNEFYRAVVATVPKVDGGEYAEGTIKNYHSKWMKRPAWITPVLISRIIKGLETEGQPIDYQYLDAINRHW